MYYNVCMTVLATDQRLGDFELLVISAILRTQPEAYGVPIRNAIQDRTGRTVTLGAVYTTLRRLEKKGLLASWAAEPTNERGGRSKRLYRVEAPGVAALHRTLADYSSMLADVLPTWPVAPSVGR